MPAETVEVLRPKLQAARRALDAALDEACDTKLEGAGTAEMIRLEELLTIARDAAGNVIALLQRLYRDPQRVDEAPDAQDTHRLFVDDRGVQWDAFAVFPSQRTKGRRSLPPPYDKGWLSLQCDEGIRRLTPIPEQWRECPREVLCQLLEKAEIVPRRTRPQEASQLERATSTS